MRVTMKKVKIEASALLMLAAMIMSDRAEILVLYYLSAGLHECGHLAAAKLMKIRIREIIFDYSGVRICPENDVMPYKKEYMLALAGPLANYLSITAIMLFLLSKGVTLTAAAESCTAFLFGGEVSGIGALSFVALSSFLQGIVNLLPVKTLDGGRMAYCLSAELLGERAGERIVDVFSAFSAFVLWTVALYLMLKVSSGLGIFVFSICLFASTLKESEIT
jgi:stage IV sporulation protein FB